MNIERLLLLSLSLAAVTLPAWAQTSLTGKIRDANTAEALAGATISIKGTTIGSSTNLNGEYELVHRGEFPITLVFKYLGYETQEVLLRQNEPLEVNLAPAAYLLGEIMVTTRRRSEEAQQIPVPIAVLGANELDNSLSFNVNRVKDLVPSVQLYSSNPRNTTLNIRGIGSTFGLTNDGLDPGVGFYVDGVYFARPAATSLDFIDVQQIEVARGPQGTLFGKNTSAGAFNITSKKPTFTRTGTAELSVGNYGFIQIKGSFAGPLVKEKLAARLSFTGTHRNGTIYNTVTDSYTNTLNNQGVRGQLLYLPTKQISLTLAADYTRQRPDGYAQVFAGVVPTLRPSFRQFEQIAADLGYAPPSRNPFDRVIDHDTPWRSDQNMGGVSLNVDWELGQGTLTSTSAWRSWKWGPSNDRDFTGLRAIAQSKAPSVHHQWSQEIRYAGKLGRKSSLVVGVFAFYQKLDADGAHVEEAGPDQWRFAQTNQNLLWRTPGLLDGYGIRTYPSFRNFSGAIFGQLDWKVSEKFTLLPGLRLNYDNKLVDFRRETYGGLQTTNPALLALQRSVYSNQAFTTGTDNWNLSGQLTLNFKPHERAWAFATYALGFKPVGLNLGGLPTNSNGQPNLELAIIKPERTNHTELGFKTIPVTGSTLNLTLFNTDIYNYQTSVQSPELGVNRGYLANADQVRTQGAELEATYALPRYLRFNLSVSYTDGRYVSFTNAPLPLEETGLTRDGQQVAFKDVSGEWLPGISKWAFAAGAEIFRKARLGGRAGEFFWGADTFFRSRFSSSPTPSQYLNIDGYGLVNTRLGFRTPLGFTFLLWARNLTNVNYFEQLLPASGNAGHYAAVLGDPRTYGLTLRYNF